MPAITMNRAGAAPKPVQDREEPIANPRHRRRRSALPRRRTCRASSNASSATGISLVPAVTTATKEPSEAGPGGVVGISRSRGGILVFEHRHASRDILRLFR